MDDGTNSGNAGGGGTGGGSTTPPSANSVWANAPGFQKDSPIFDVAVGGGGPAPPTSGVDLGMAATTVYGLQFYYTGGMYSSTQFGANCTINVSPEALIPGNFGAPWRAAALGNLSCGVGPAATILFGRQITIHHGPEEIKFSSQGKGAIARILVLVIVAVTSAYGVACYLLADNVIWGQEKEGDLVAAYQAAMQILLTACMVGYVHAAHAEEEATAALFESAIGDHMGVDS